MKPTILPVITMAVFVCLIGCSSPKPGRNVYHLDPKSWPTKTIALDDIIQDVRVVPLETRDTAMITNISKIQLSKDRIYVLDANMVLCFNSDGRFLKRISKPGRGPGEYRYAGGVSLLVNEEKSEFLINVFNARKLLYFSLDGEFLRQNNGSYYGSRMALINPDVIAMHSGRMMEEELTGHELFLTNWEGTVQKTLFPFSKRFDLDSFRGFAKGTVSGSVLYHKVFDYTIYEISTGAVDTLMAFDFGSAAVDTSKALSFNDFFISLNKPGTVQGIEVLASTDDHLTATLAMDFKPRGTWVLDHKTGNQRFFSSDSLQQLGTYHGLPIPFPETNQGQWFIAWVEGLDWSASMDNLSGKDREFLRSRVNRFDEADKVTENGNPILVFYKFAAF